MGPTAGPDRDQGPWAAWMGIGGDGIGVRAKEKVIGMRVQPAAGYSAAGGRRRGRTVALAVLTIALSGGAAAAPGPVPRAAAVSRAELSPTAQAARSRSGGGVAVGVAADAATGGYWVVMSTGQVKAVTAPALGSLTGHVPPGAAVTAIAAGPRGGYLILTSDGGVHAFGTPWHGSDAGRLRHGDRAVGLAVDPATGGYWILTSTGRVDAFAAPRRGSLAGKIGAGGTAAGITAGRPGGYLVMTTAGGPVPASLAGRVWNVIPTRRKVVALTFDIGPHNGLASILATLGKDHVPGTFFLVGGTVKKLPAIARSIAAAGQRAGDHSNRHPHFPRVSPARMRSEVLTAQAELRKTTGLDPWPWFRFPYGDYNAQAVTIVNAAGFVPIGWTVDTLGWKGTSHGITVPIIVHRVLAHRRPGEIVLMHGGTDTGDNSALDAQALPTVITKLRALGYSFVSIDTLGGLGARARTADGQVTGFSTPTHGSDSGKLQPGVTAIGLATDPATGGYWILTSTGKVDAFAAPRLGSLAGHIPPGTLVTAITASQDGYLILTSTGHVYTFTPQPATRPHSTPQAAGQPLPR
jgi:peptidoglycan/xylan/chitin deacetylase (PgdA/CDA1 family)